MNTREIAEHLYNYHRLLKGISNISEALSIENLNYTMLVYNRSNDVLEMANTLHEAKLEINLK